MKPFRDHLREAAALVEEGGVCFRVVNTPPDAPRSAVSPFTFIIAVDEVTPIRGGYLLIGDLSRDQLEALRDGCAALLEGRDED